ncbi:hypothetical protein MHLNE_23660 [Moorella humiferrea]|uniref:hypothetical protein n=1 Tax=Neomoorella humiferrea TaxID=676965 RepID=UPI0030D5E4B1
MFPATCNHPCPYFYGEGCELEGMTGGTGGYMGPCPFLIRGKNVLTGATILPAEILPPNFATFPHRRYQGDAPACGRGERFKDGGGPSGRTAN